MSLRDGTKKMSKSDPSDLSRINMTDDADTVSKKIQKAKTDTEPLPSDEKGFEGRPEAENLVGIYAALSGEPVANVLRDYGGQQFSAFKKALAEVATEKVGRIGAEATRLMGDRAEIDRILADGSARAREVAAPVMAKVKDIVGFIRS
jgi:tryptophanyl-tRNA synthetase